MNKSLVARIAAKMAGPINPGGCEYVADGLRCRYPGSQSSSTVGGGPWYCRWHFDALRAGDAAYGQIIVDESQDYRAPTNAEEDKKWGEHVAASTVRESPSTVSESPSIVRDSPLATSTAPPARDWAIHAKSQRAVDLMFTPPPMTAQIEAATQAGTIIGRRWIPPGERNRLPPQQVAAPEPELCEPGELG